jgi:hypothetical protein
MYGHSPASVTFTWNKKDRTHKNMSCGENNFETNLKETEGGDVDWVDVTQDIIQSWVLLEWDAKFLILWSLIIWWLVTKIIVYDHGNISQSVTTKYNFWLLSHSFHISIVDIEDTK